MFNKATFWLMMLFFISNCSEKTQNKNGNSRLESKTHDTMMTKRESNLPETEEQWKAKLSDEEYRILRKKGTEPAFSGKYYDHHESGIYVCKGCGAELFRSDTKFDAHCGWPSFYDAIDKSKIKETLDLSYGMSRTEVTCANCGGHLGHVFNDGPTDKTGLRYCINSVSIGFIPKEQTDTTKVKK